MPARTVDLETIPYRIFVNRERGLYRGFWFCPHHDCFGAYRCDHVSETSEEAVEIAAEAARMHEAEVHSLDQVDDLYPELQYDAAQPAGIKIHG
jgi:hypothetical protein